MSTQVHKSTFTSSLSCNTSYTTKGNSTTQLCKDRINLTLIESVTSLTVVAKFTSLSSLKGHIPTGHR